MATCHQTLKLIEMTIPWDKSDLGSLHENQHFITYNVINDNSYLFYLKKIKILIFVGKCGRIFITNIINFLYKLLKLNISNNIYKASDMPFFGLYHTRCWTTKSDMLYRIDRRHYVSCEFPHLLQHSHFPICEK